MILICLFLSLILLLLKNLLLIFILLIFILGYSYILNLPIKNFFLKLESLSVFCLSIFFSYIFLAFLKQNEHIIFLYMKDATVLVLKIIDILFLNMFLEKIGIKNFLNNDFFKFIFDLMNKMEKILFEIINSYNGKVEKILNIDKIIVTFFVSSLKLIEKEKL